MHAGKVSLGAVMAPVVVARAAGQGCILDYGDLFAPGDKTEFRYGAAEKGDDRCRGDGPQVHNARIVGNQQCAVGNQLDYGIESQTAA